jgi:hypothetical protein
MREMGRGVLSLSEKLLSKIDQTLLQHRATYEAHEFTFKRVTSDGEPAVKAVRATLVCALLYSCQHDGTI